jgi:hypothetical protein
MTKEKAKDYLHGKMEECMTVSGRMANSMALEYLLPKKI